MRLVQARFVTACQQLLALGVVLAVLTPAAGVISLDIVGQAPRRRPARPAGGHLRRRCASATRARPPPVEPSVTEVPLTTGTRQRPARWPATTVRRRLGRRATA